MRILLVSQMYPGPEDPDLGVFVRRLADELAARGHDVERVDEHAGFGWDELGRPADTCRDD